MSRNPYTIASAAIAPMPMAVRGPVRRGRDECFPIALDRIVFLI